MEFREAFWIEFVDTGVSWEVFNYSFDAAIKRAFTSPGIKFVCSEHGERVATKIVHDSIVLECGCTKVIK